MLIRAELHQVPCTMMAEAYTPWRCFFQDSADVFGAQSNCMVSQNWVNFSSSIGAFHRDML